MIAVVKVKEAPGREGTEIRDVPKPEPGKGEALIRVAATSICGTDRHIYNWDPTMANTVRPPLTYGHEFCGYIEAFGPDTYHTKVREGDYVSAEMHVVCGYCHQCRTGQGHICANTRILGLHGNGCFAEYVTVPVENIVTLDPSIPYHIASFLDALGNAVHTIQPVNVVGKDVLVAGYGPIGGMAVSLAHYLGARKIIVTDVVPFALDHASRWAEEKGLGDRFLSLNAMELSYERQREAILDLCPHGIDVLLEMSGAASAINLGLEVMKKGGEASLLGIPGKEEMTLTHYSRDVIFKGITLHAIIGRRMYDTWFTMIKLLHSGLDVEHVVSRVYDTLEDFHEGMDLFNRHEALKVVFQLKH
ncbi:MAG TPA: alcohol dehydrogenase catalytic domain-containing protein [Thermoanaerobaculia bacterium]|nr:alcohol dehydrogenase catalytic domain-containing protein [Thermoanaerobaculia bacterium]HUM30826.1 alcohol dehydrogenase catalytic domain-containing protein [Thermoanaerobaculia bacterium]HXK69161.1 alcohol dehydrogenase catalytic domain-containing protein [Thermoanaerobaculia bacterium]